MNIEYRMLWIDDSIEFKNSLMEIIEEKFKENNMLPVINFYDNYKEYEAEQLDAFDIDTFNLYDQILVDYDLSMQDMNGNKLIQHLRDRNIVTDIVFYSGNDEKMRDELKTSRHLDGVFMCSKKDLVSTVIKVVKKNLRREYEISNIRGLIMDSTSDFDYTCRGIINTLFYNLTDAGKNMIVQKIENYITNAKTKSHDNFNNIEKKREKLLEYVDTTINSVDYVMDNKDRYQVMIDIIKEYYEENGKDAQQLNGEILQENFVETYHNNLIKHRNKLAHNKIFYGKCKKKLCITKKWPWNDCGEKHDECKNYYDIETCEQLRKKIYEYHKIFEDVSKVILQNLKKF